MNVTRLVAGSLFFTPEAVSAAFSGAFSGAFSAAGAGVSSLAGSCALSCAGEEAGSKLTKAQELGVTIITETQFDEMTH